MIFVTRSARAARMKKSSATGLAATPAWTAESNQGSALFGYSVSTAGDVNGDGYSDVIVGSPYFNAPETDEGRAYVYHGSPGGLAAGSVWTGEPTRRAPTSASPCLRRAT